MVTQGALAEPHSGVELQKNQVEGIIVAGREASISVGLSARVSDVPFNLGDRFVKGDVLIEFNCKQMQAELEALKAQQSSLGYTHKNNVELFEGGAAGALDVDIGMAEYARAKAEAKAKEAELSDCIIRAPYDGFIAERHVDPFETPAPGSPLFKIIDASALEIKLLAPVSMIDDFAIGETFTFFVSEIDASLQAEVKRRGVAIDPVSQTIDIVGQLVADTPNVVAGMSGRVTKTEAKDLKPDDGTKGILGIQQRPGAQDIQGAQNTQSARNAM